MLIPVLVWSHLCELPTLPTMFWNLFLFFVQRLLELSCFQLLAASSAPTITLSCQRLQLYWEAPLFGQSSFFLSGLLSEYTLKCLLPAVALKDSVRFPNTSPIQNTGELLASHVRADNVLFKSRGSRIILNTIQKYSAKGRIEAILWISMMSGTL